MKKFLLVLVVLAVVAAPAMATNVYELFNYADGSLNGVGGWAGGTGSQVTVSSNTALLTYDNGVRGTTLTKDFAPVTGDTIWWCVYVKVGNPASGSNAFDLRLEDAEGDPFARWYGGAEWERPRIGDTGYVLGNALLTPGIWNLLCVEINTIAKTSTFELNNTVLGTLNYGAASANTSNVVSRVRMGFQNGTVEMNGGTKYYDDMLISNEGCPEPGSMLALLSGLVGIVGFARRRK